MPFDADPDPEFDELLGYVSIGNGKVELAELVSPPAPTKPPWQPTKRQQNAVAVFGAFLALPIVLPAYFVMRFVRF